MRFIRLSVAVGLALAAFGAGIRAQDSRPEAPPSPVHGLEMQRIDGTKQKLSDYKGKVLLVVNVASECGYTPQYEGLQKLHEKYGPRGFSVLGFPSNDFGKQEPGTDREIFEFCRDRFSVRFPLFSKIAVAGPNATPLYRYLQEESPRKAPVKWNFHKFLLDGAGNVIASFGTKVPPEDPKLQAAIEEALSGSGGAASRPGAEGVKLLIVAFDGLELADSSKFSIEREKERRSEALKSGAAYAAPPGIEWHKSNHDEGGEFLYYDPEFWGEGKAGFTGADLQAPKASLDRIGQRTIEAGIEPDRQEAFKRYTAKWVGKAMAVVVDREIIMAPVIQGALKESIVLSNPGGFTPEQQRTLVERLGGGKK
jgi:glutathione peroxidase